MSNPCVGMWSNWLGENRETDEEHDEGCARAKLDRNGKGARKALGTGNWSIKILDGSELELAWSKKSSSYFENNFPICLLFGISSTPIFKLRDVLHWENF